MPDPTFKIDSTTVLSKSGTTVSIDSGVKFPAGGTGNPISIAIVGDKKSSGTSGGGYSADAWSKRTLNFESDPDSIVTYA